MLQPASLDCPGSRTPVTLTAQVKLSKGDYIYLKTVYAPLRVYADGELIFQYGQDGSYPAFLLDPPTKVTLFRLPDRDGDMTLTFEYLSPSQRNQNRQLAFEVSLMEKQIEAQKDRYQMLTEMSTALQRQCHDLKHHMAVIRQWAARGDEEKENLMAYLDQVSAEIPEGFIGRLCENEAVNALALYYQTAAREAGIPIVIHLNIPANTGQVPASDLCVIIGNFMENGIEACKMAEKPFLTLRSRLFNGVLTITMDNSFRFVSRTAEGAYCSSKPGGGTGLISVKSVAEKYGGNCSFEDKDGVFYSSVYLPLSI